MNTYVLAAFAALSLTATLSAEDPKPSAFLEPGKEYSIQLTENAKLTDFRGRVTILSAPQAGWVRIEYFPFPLRASGSPPPPKRQIWLNLSQVVSVEDAKPLTKEPKE